MKKQLFTIISILALTFAASASFAAGSADNSTQGSTHSALGTSQIAVGSAQSAASAVAIPLVGIGSVGVASGVAGSAIIDSADAFEPLEITDTVIVHDQSPEQAMQ